MSQINEAGKNCPVYTSAELPLKYLKEDGVESI